MYIGGIEYKKIPGFPSYYAGYDGSIYSSKSNKLRVLRANKSGYLRVNIQDENYRTHTLNVHRLVASTWIQNPENKPHVHHKDEDKSNNSVDNLMWVTARENNEAGTRSIRSSKKQLNSKKKSKPVILTNIDTGAKLEFPSVHEAIRNGYRVDSVLSGSNQTVKGYTAEYVKKEGEN